MPGLGIGIGLGLLRSGAVSPRFTLTFTPTAPGQTATLQRITPTGKSVTLDWGDGNTETIASGNTGSKSHVYAGMGPYSIRISDPDVLTWVEARSDTKIAVNMALADLPASMTTLHLGSTSSTITGSLADLPASMTTLYLYSTSSTITGSLADLPASMTTLYLYSTSSTITGGATAMAATGIRIVEIQTTSLSQTNVDDVIDRLYTDRAAFTYATPSLNIGGTNAAPSASPEIDTYIPALQSAGWTVTYTAP